MKKMFDIVCKVGEYTDAEGATKARWQTVGAMMEGDKGPFLLLAKWFNPAGVIDPKGGESLLLSLFAPKEREGGYRQSEPSAAKQVRSVAEVPSAAKTAAVQRAAKAPAPAASDDQIPF